MEISPESCKHRTLEKLYSALPGVPVGCLVVKIKQQLTKESKNCRKLSTCVRPIHSEVRFLPKKIKESFKCSFFSKHFASQNDAHQKFILFALRNDALVERRQFTDDVKFDDNNGVVVDVVTRSTRLWHASLCVNNVCRIWISLDHKVDRSQPSHQH